MAWIVGIPIALALTIHFLFCVLSLFPLSRFWLPNNITSLMISIINTGLRLGTACIFRRSYEAVLLMIFKAFSYLVKWLFLTPIYWMFGILFKDKLICKVSRKVRYFANIAE